MSEAMNNVFDLSEYRGAGRVKNVICGGSEARVETGYLNLQPRAKGPIDNEEVVFGASSYFGITMHLRFSYLWW